MMNAFWMRLDVVAKDVVFTEEPKSLCELGDPSEFIQYGEARCMKLGLEDDAEAAIFLSQAFQGDVISWYKALPEQVQSSWCLLKQALLEEFGNGQVLESMHLLCQVWWQVPNFEECFEALWKVYAHVSFFHDSFVHALKDKMLEKYKKAYMELQDLYEDECVDDTLQGSKQKDITGVESGFKNIISIQEGKISSSFSCFHNESEAMDNVSSDEVTSFLDTESLYASLTIGGSDKSSSICDGGQSMHNCVASPVGSLKNNIDHVYEEDSMNDTWGLGIKEDILQSVSEQMEVVECEHHGIEDMEAKDMNFEGTKGDFLDLEFVKEDDLWDIASFDEVEPKVDMDACMEATIAKATLRIKNALEKRGDNLASIYESMQVEEFTKDHVYVENKDSWIFLAGLYEGKVDLENTCKMVVMEMLRCAAMHYALWKLFDANELGVSKDSFLWIVKACSLGDSMNLFDTFVGGKACTHSLFSECKEGFYFDLRWMSGKALMAGIEEHLRSFDPGGWDGKMLVFDWETDVWPFDPGGFLSCCLA